MTEPRVVEGPMKCRHPDCGQKTMFELSGSYQLEYEETGSTTVTILWKLVKCLTCEEPTLLREISTHELDDRFTQDEIDQAEYYNNPTIEIVYPVALDAPLASEDMPKELRGDYKEACAVLPYSPRASAALLRLVIEKLLIYLKKPGENIDARIQALVNDGLAPQVQQALDSVRVIGNNAVHPGKMDIKDNTELALKLFELTNFIIHETITRPREIQAIYDMLPEGQKKDRYKSSQKNEPHSTN